MNLDSPLFLGFVVIAIAANWLLPITLRKTVAFPIANLAFLLLAAPRLASLWPLAVLLISGYVVIRLQTLRQDSSVLKLGGVGLMVAEFVYFKGYSFLPEIGIRTFPFFALGMSYALFRIIHLIVDTSASGQFQPRSFVRYFSYLAFFPAFASGPVQLYPDFEKQLLSQNRVDSHDAAAALGRIVLGYLKCVVAGDILASMQHGFYLQSISGAPIELVAGTLACVVYLFYLYANFSGYIDVVIGIAKLLGMALPENFVRPFSARSFLDLWSVWHMTMSNWFKIYLFNPTVKALSERWPAPKMSQWFGVFGFFVTFFVMGLWHGTTFSFCIYGLVLGAGASLNKIYQVLIKKVLDKRVLASLRRNYLYRALCRGATYSYFSLGLMCFWLSTEQLPRFFSAIGGTLGVIAAFVIGSVGLAIVFELGDAIAGLYRKLAIGQSDEIAVPATQ